MWALYGTVGAGRMGSIRCEVAEGCIPHIGLTRPPAAPCPGGVPQPLTPLSGRRFGPGTARGAAGGSGAGAGTGGALSAGRSPPHRADARAARRGRGGGTGHRRRGTHTHTPGRAGGRPALRGQAGQEGGGRVRSRPRFPWPCRRSRAPSGIPWPRRGLRDTIPPSPLPGLGSRSPRPGAGSCITLVRSGRAGGVCVSPHLAQSPPTP